MLFVWLGALSFSFNKLSPKAYLPNEYYLLNFLQASMQKQVSCLIISYGDVKELEIQLKYTVVFFPGFFRINKKYLFKEQIDSAVT